MIYPSAQCELDSRERTWFPGSTTPARSLQPSHPLLSPKIDGTCLLLALDAPLVLGSHLMDATALRR